MAKNASSVIGSWAFLVGFVLALVLGLLNLVSPTVAVVLVIIGVLVGLFNIADKETMPFLMSGAVLIIASSLGKNVAGTVPFLGRVLDAFLLIFVPATVIVAMRNVFTLAKN